MENKMENNMDNTRKFLDVEEAMEIISCGGIIIMTDNEDRENEGDLVQAAEKATPESVNFMAAYGKGLICVPLDIEDAERLGLKPMTADNDSFHETAFTVSVDLKEGIASGISAQDRAMTIMKLADPAGKPQDFVRPGHIFPLTAKKGGVLERNGHTEGSLDLVKLAGLKPAAVICEILDTDGTMARGERLESFAEKHSLGILSIKRLTEYLNKEKEKNLSGDFLKIQLPTKYGDFEMLLEESETENDQRALFTIMKNPLDLEKPVYVRIHSECTTGDILHSLKCDCGEQLERSFEIIEQNGGIIIYLKQEGRGIGLREKIKAYTLQEKGADTVEANILLGHEADRRNYSEAAVVLKKLGIKKIKLLTNNPAKLGFMQNRGFEEISRAPLEVLSNRYNSEYLNTKKIKMGHIIGESI